MKTTIILIGIGILSFVLANICIPIIRKTALLLNLVDKPNYRKVHTQPIPLVGGISIGLVFCLSSFVFINEVTFINYLPILFSAYVLLVVGVVDDKKDIKAKYKLIIQLLLSFFIALSGTRITSLYGLFEIGEINLYLQYILTILVITGVVNAFNLMDGVDGLVGSLSLIGFIILLIAGFVYNDTTLGKICMVFIGTIIGFLKYNFSKDKIFMGDAGSLFLGFILVCLGIHMLESQVVNKENNPLYVTLIVMAFFIIPVLDSIRVYLTRIKKGYSPFKADKSHLHHILLRLGFSHKNITVWISAFILFMFIIGLGLINLTSITKSVLTLILVFYLILKFLVFIINLYKWHKKIKELESIQ